MEICFGFVFGFGLPVTFSILVTTLIISTDRWSRSLQSAHPPGWCFAVQFLHYTRCKCTPLPPRNYICVRLCVWESECDCMCEWVRLYVCVSECDCMCEWVRLHVWVSAIVREYLCMNEHTVSRFIVSLTHIWLLATTLTRTHTPSWPTHTALGPSAGKYLSKQSLQQLWQQ